MNAARGRLKSILHAGIWERVGQLLREGRASTTCTHAPESAGLFLDALVHLGTYPLEEIWPKNSVTQVLRTLSRFSDLRTGQCGVCTVEWKPHVENAVEKTEGYFDGLCLDCMKRSWLPRGKDPDTEYWSANGSDKGRWDMHCRIKHGQPTWYASFCGRDEFRQRMIKDHNEEKRGGASSAGGGYAWCLGFVTGVGVQEGIDMIVKSRLRIKTADKREMRLVYKASEWMMHARSIIQWKTTHVRESNAITALVTEHGAL
jgi:hypothetical protein